MKLGLHQHYKGGIYNVLFTANNANSHEMERGALTIVYQCEKTGQVYTRDYTEFAAGVDHDGQRVARFKYVQEDPSIATHFRMACADRLLYRERPGGFDFFSPRAGKWVSSTFDQKGLEQLSLTRIEEA